MKTTIEAHDYKTREILVVEVGGDEWGDNIVITKTDPTDETPRPISIAFPLDAETARAISFALGELAKELGKRK